MFWRIGSSGNSQAEPLGAQYSTNNQLRSAQDVQTRTQTLMGLHDEIAELKAHYDAHKTLQFHGWIPLPPAVQAHEFK